MNAIKKILCPVDFLQHSPMVAEYAAMLAKTFDAEVEVLYVSLVLSDMGGHHEAEPAQIKAIENDLYASSGINMETFINQHFAGVRVTGKVELGEPTDMVIKRIKESGADLVVMGTHGRRGLNRLVFGSVAQRVVQMSPVPVLTVRPLE